jgi:hypothetical protein
MEILTETEIRIQDYIARKHNKKFNDFILPFPQGFILYREMMEAFEHYKDYITIEKHLAHDYAKLVLSHAPKYGVDINIANKTDSFYYLNLSGFKPQLESLDKFCQDIYAQKPKKSLKNS